MTTTELDDAGPPGTDDLGADADAPDRPGPGTAFWIVLAVAALVLGGAIGWRVGKAGTTTEQPSRASVDVGFFQDMTTHHLQALTMGFDYLSKGTDPLLRQNAARRFKFAPLARAITQALPALTTRPSPPTSATPMPSIASGDERRWIASNTIQVDAAVRSSELTIAARTSARSQP